MNLDPRHLAQLSMIVEAGTFQAAADRLRLSQPALSRNMRLLEARLGAPIFNRVGRSAVPTEIGRRLARDGLVIRIAEERAGGYADLVGSGAAGELRIGAPPIIAGRFLTDRLTGFIRANPECVVEIRVGLVHELRTMLDRGQIDVVIGPRILAETGSELTFMPLIDDRVGILCRAGHPMLDRAQVSPRDLEDQVWVAHSRGSLLRQQSESALIEMGVERTRIGCETDSIRSVLEIVAETDLISTMPRVTTRPYLQDKLTFLDLDHPRFHRPIGAIRPSDAPESTTMDAFLRAAGVGHRVPEKS